MKKTVAFLILCCVMTIALVLPSCITKSSSTRTASTSPTTTATATTSTTVTSAWICDTQLEPTPSTPAPQYGGKLTIFNPWSSGTAPGFDTLNANQGSVSEWINLYLDYLVTADIEKYGPRVSNQFAFQTWTYVPEQYVTGRLAESWEITNSAVLTYVFHLRKGVMWTGNQKIGMTARELVASDVVSTLKRSLTSPTSAYSLNFIKSVTVLDKYAVSVEFAAVNANWVQLFGGGLPQGAIMAPESIAAGAEDWRNAVGTGPFILQNFVEGSGATYVRNPSYWGKATLNGKEYKLPFVDTVYMAIISDEYTQVAALRAGKIDWSPNVKLVYGDIMEKTSPEVIQQKYLNGDVENFRFNRQTSEYFTDKNLRRALMIGTDLNEIAFVFGSGNIYSWPIEAGTPGFTHLNELPSSQKELWTYDPAKAKQLIVAAGYPNGFGIEIDVDNTHQDFAMICAYYWGRLGVKATIKTLDSTSLMSIVNGVKYADVIWCSNNINNPYITLGMLQSTVTGATYKASEPFEAMYNAVAGTADPVKRTALVKELALAFMDDVGVIPYLNSCNLNCYWPWVRNYYGELETGFYNRTPIVERMWIDQNLKKSLGN